MPTPHESVDVLVIGAGHAGCEAALAAARLGARTLLLTLNLDHIAQMSCNPAIGGIAKGQVVREIDAMGGEMALNADAATIQFRMLNCSKGPAVWSPRAQCDKIAYQYRMKLVLERQPNLFTQQAQAVAFLTNGQRVCGVRSEFGDEWRAGAVIVATGTFLNAQLHYGMQSFSGGRAGDAASVALATSLVEDLRLPLGRLKTGTPTRVLGSSIDLASLKAQPADADPAGFSFRPQPEELRVPRAAAPRELPCYLTNSTEKTAEIIRANLDKSPMYSGKISGTGTRYCPSFEDKVVRFPQHPTHQIHLEPEGVSTEEYYLNGISTSLPPEVQWQMVRSLPGLEHAHITRYAYAIEYDFVQPHILSHSLAVRDWPNLFLAGQINGTSGYEEAAAQGLMAGINAARLVAGQPPIVLQRDQAYIGVMIDDLITKTISEPYRLFTSRAEYRLLLRQDNADLRLTPLGREIGLVDEKTAAKLTGLVSEMDQAREILRTTRQKGNTLWDLLKRPDSDYDALSDAPAVSARARRQLTIEARYQGYISREQQQAERMRRLADWRIPDDFDFHIQGLRAEARQKLEKIRPATLAQAARIDGVTPAEIALLQVHLGRRRKA